nr:nitrate- and nitrite sensing domain-containing protein [Wenjunlia vitaminophila]
MVLLLVPLVSLVSLWAFTAVDAVQDVMDLRDIDDVQAAFGRPMEATMLAIQDERRQAMLYLSQREDARSLKELQASQARTDGEIEKLRNSARDGDKRDILNDRQNRGLDVLLKELNKVEELREKINSGSVDRFGAFKGYTALVDPGYSLFADLGAINNNDLSKHFGSMVTLVRAWEAVTREDSLVSAALASGDMSQGEYRALSAAISEQRVLFTLGVKDLPAESREEHLRLAKGKIPMERFRMEEKILNAGAEGAATVVKPDEWRANIIASNKVLAQMAHERASSYADRAEPYETRVNVYAAVVGILGLLAVIASIIISVRIARALVRDLTRLRKAALELSGTRLPRVMRRLASGESVDVRSEAPDMEFRDSDDEINQVGQAFNDVQRAAVEAAVKQAELRQGVSEIFVNLARRSQVLVHRQLTLLDAMERRTEDAEELADLFRLDHLTTRMRRHAEGLVILSGSAPSRAWRNPVQLINVIRAAVSEVEDYERVEVRRIPRVAVVGSAVADITHLIAELVENATVFSPPHTQVQVHGERVANGFVLEIDDRGLGMTPDALLEANQRLAETPEFELSDTDRLGLFVVSRLARRLGVRVSLRPSPYGGTSAVVLVPSTLLTDDQNSATAEQPAMDTADSERGEDDNEERPVGERAKSEEAFREWGVSPVSDLPGDDLPADHEADQHDQAPDSVGAGDGNVPRLPRRRSPVLVADRGRPVERLPRPVPAGEHDAGRSAGRHAAPSGESGGTPGTGKRRAGSRGTAGAGQEESGYSLPKRVRQASIAPQLRVQQPDAETTDDAPVRERSADEVRSRMASFQRGFQRGRTLDGDLDGGSGDGGAGRQARQAPGTSTERDGR